MAIKDEVCENIFPSGCIIVFETEEFPILSDCLVSVVYDSCCPVGDVST